MQGIQQDINGMEAQWRARMAEGDLAAQQRLEDADSRAAGLEKQLHAMQVSRVLCMHGCKHVTLCIC